MTCRMSIMCLAIAIALPLVAQASNVEYLGPNGAMGTAGNWYTISNINDPTSTTGPTGFPAAGDWGIVRNGRTGTVDFTLSGERLYVGGPQITGQTTAPPTVVTVANGGTITLHRMLGTYGAELRIGEYYNGTLNVAGGTVKTTSPLTGGLRLGNSAGATGVVNISSGLIDLHKPYTQYNALRLGSVNQGVGIVNQSGGRVDLRSGFSPDNSLSLGGNGGRGLYRLSGGYLGNEASGHLGIGGEWDEEGGTYLPTGVGMFEQTGGTFRLDYRMIVGQNAGLGHWRALGGTLTSPLIGSLGTGQIWLGRWKDAPPTGGSWTGCGKITVNQDAYIDLDGIHMGVAVVADPGGTAPGSTQMELKINRLGSFGMDFYQNSYLHGRLEVSFTDGFQPAVGNEWRIMTWDRANIGSPLEVEFGQITPGFRLEKRSKELWMVCEAVRKPGDANNDGFVDVGDLGILAFNWGRYLQTPDQGDDIFGCSWEEADFTGDDAVDVGDLGVLAFNWGWVGTPAAPGQVVPEPASLALLGLGGLAMLRRRR